MKEETFISIRKSLKKMRLSGMAEELTRQFESKDIDLMSADERICRMITCEETLRSEKKFHRFLKQSGLRYPAAVLDEKLFSTERCDEPTLLNRLATSSDWIENGKNILITGMTGTGKTTAACALAVGAMHKFYTVRYKRCSYLLNELSQAEKENRLIEVLEKLQKIDILILDDFGSMDLDMIRCRSLFELIESREDRKTTIFISQFPTSSWYDMFPDNTFADACMDRILNGSFRINLKGDSFRRQIRL